MIKRRVSTYRLRPSAQADLDHIWDYTAREWSVDQAESYLQALGAKLDDLCDYPEVVRERTEVDPPIRLYAFQAHVIIYQIEGDHLAILRILGNRQNWKALLQE